MPTIHITVYNKLARLLSDPTTGRNPFIVCGNSDYAVHFNFDEEWDAYLIKTARFKWERTYKDVVFTGNTCPIPPISNTNSIRIGVYVGSTFDEESELHTTTSAIVPCRSGVLCGNEVESDGELLCSNDIIDYIDQYTERLDALEKGSTAVFDEETGELTLGGGMTFNEETGELTIGG